MLPSLPRHVLLAADPIAPPSQPTKPGQTLPSDPTRSSPPGLDPSPRYRSGYPRPTMVTTTAPPPFLARISAGTEDPRRLPSALLQRLRRGDSNCENQPSCCLAGPASGQRPALKRVRRRKGKIRPGHAGLLPSRYQQYQQHRAGLGRRTPLAAHGPGELRAHPVPAPSSAPGLATVPPEEPPAPAPQRPAPSKPLRKEVKTGLRYFCTFLFPTPFSRAAAAGEPLAPLPLPSPLCACGRAGEREGEEFPLRPLGRGGGREKGRGTAGGDWPLGATNRRRPLRPATAGFSLLAARQLPPVRAGGTCAGRSAPWRWQEGRGGTRPAEGAQLPARCCWALPAVRANGAVVERRGGARRGVAGSLSSARPVTPRE